MSTPFKRARRHSGYLLGIVAITAPVAAVILAVTIL